MRQSVKVALAASGLAVAGGLFLAGSGLAGPMNAFGPRHGFGPMPMMADAGREMLKSVDTNGDGAISQDEINAAVNARFTEFDADHNGSLSLQEFEALWAEITKPMAVRAFQFLDPNGDAAVSKDELDSRFGDIVNRFDRNKDGVLSPADHGPGGRRGGPGGHFGWRGGPDAGGPGGWHNGPRAHAGWHGGRDWRGGPGEDCQGPGSMMGPGPGPAPQPGDMPPPADDDGPQPQ